MMHWHECEVLNQVFDKFMELMNVDHKVARSPLLIYHAVEGGVSIRPILNCIHKVMWSFIIPSLAGVDEDNKPFVPDQVWRSTLWRLLIILRQQAHGVRCFNSTIIQARNIDNPQVVENLLAPRRARLHPLAHVTDEGTLSLFTQSWLSS